MKKFLLFFLVFFLSSFTAIAKDQRFISDFSSINPTVKIISYDSSFNGDIYALKSGSGTIIRNDGIILTNYHVVSNNSRDLNAFEICLSPDDNKKTICEYTAGLIASSPELDLAILRIDKEDIRGKRVGNLNYLSYRTETEKKIGDEITILGYPGIGRDSLTSTQGVISGFIDIQAEGNPRFIKSDGDISSGNSGGTILDKNGNFIAVPSKAALDIDTLGYFIDLSSVKDWITKSLNNKVRENKNELIKEKKILFNDANFHKKLDFPFYPNFELKIDENWFFDYIDNGTIGLISENIGTEPIYLQIVVERLPFKVSDEYLDHLLGRLEENRDYFSDYKRESKTFAGKKAELITFNNDFGKYYNYLIPYGYAALSISYEVDFNDAKKTEDKIEKVLSSFKFEESAKKLKKKTSYTHTNPAFSVKTYGDFYLKKNEQAYNKNLILNFLDHKDFVSQVTIEYYELMSADKEKNSDDILETYVKSFSYDDSFTLINKEKEVFVDGLEGWSFTYSYFDNSLLETLKTSQVFLREGDFYYLFTYDDSAGNFDEKVNDFKKIVLSFNSKKSKSKKEDFLGSMNYIFDDIAAHRFINSISKLKDRKIIHGYSDGNFYPENLINRAEALKMIIKGKFHAKNQSFFDEQLEKFGDISYLYLDFTDNNQGDWFSRYLRYARSEKIIQGYLDGSFQAQQNISLAETLVILFKAFDIKVWQDERANTPWHKSYMDAAFRLGILDYDMTDPHKQITRAEMSYLLDRMIN